MSLTFDEKEKVFNQEILQPPVIDPLSQFFSSTDNGVLNLSQGQLQSPNYAPGVAGWKVDAQGNAEFQSLISNLSAVTKLYTASEALSMGDAVAIGDGLQYLLSNDTSNSVADIIDASAWWSQSFTTSASAISIKGFSIKMHNDNTASSTTTTFSVRADSGGSPTGSDIGGLTATTTDTIPASPGETVVTATFSTAVTVSPNTTYHLIVRISDNSGTHQFKIHRGGSSGVGTNKSANSGSTWSSSNGKLFYNAYEIDTVAGQVCKTTAGNTSRARNQSFIGFATTSATANNSARIAISGEATGLSGITTGAFYYLSNTLGAIASSAGTVSRKIGIGTSTTTVLITNLW